MRNCEESERRVKSLITKNWKAFHTVPSLRLPLCISHSLAWTFFQCLFQVIGVDMPERASATNWTDCRHCRHFLSLLCEITFYLLLKGPRAYLYHWCTKIQPWSFFRESQNILIILCNILQHCFSIMIIFIKAFSAETFVVIHSKFCFIHVFYCPLASYPRSPLSPMSEEHDCISIMTSSVRIFRYLHQT